MKLVSVIVRTKDRPALLREALASLSSQKYPALEVIVVNDGGTEVEDLANEFAGNFYRLKYLRHDSPRGRAPAANTGLAAVEGDYFAFLDDDDLWLPWTLTTLLKAAKDFPDVPVVYGVSRAVVQERNQTRFVRLYDYKFSRPRLYFENYIPMGSFLVQRKAASNLSFDETLSCLEDWEFLLKLAERGDFFFVKHLVHIYRLQTESFAIGEKASYEKEKIWIEIYRRFGKNFSPEKLYTLWKELKEELLHLEHQSHLWQEHFLRLHQAHNFFLEEVRRKDAYYETKIESLETKYLRYKKEKENLQRELENLQRELADRDATLALIYDSLGWYLLSRYRALKEKILPPQSKRRRGYDLALKGLKVLLKQGPRAFCQKSLQFLSRRHLPPSTPRPVLPVRSVGPEDICLPKVEKPRVSIIIPVFNKVSLTLNVLDSLAKNTPPIYEVIVVDDASTDNTAELLPRIQNLRYFRHEENKGFVETVNKGASLASGDFLVFLNNDVLLTPGWLEALLLPFQDERVGLVGAKLIYPDGRLQEAGGIIFRDASGWNYGRKEDPAAPEFNFRREVDYCSGACLVVPRKIFKRLGGFDTLYRPAYYEDTDLAFKVREQGLKVIYQPRAEIYHLEGASCGQDLHTGLKRYQVINQEKFYQKWQKVLKKSHFSHDPSLIFLARQRQGRGIIIVADHYVPTWDKDSGSLRLYNLLQMMRELDYRVIFWPDNLAALQPYTEKLQNLGIEVIYGSRDFKAYLKDNARFIDLLWACRVRFAPRYLAPAREFGVHTVFDTIDLHFLREEREARLKGDPNLLARAQETKKLELTLCRSADFCVVVSEYEKEILEAEGIKNVVFLPNVHDPAPRGPGFAEREGLVFIGSFQHPPNEDAVCWFVEDILPIVRREISQVRFFIVGASPTAKVKALSRHEGVIVTGYVPEVRPWFHKSRIFVAPLRYGAGLKGKVGQALSYGLPSVLTPIAAEGMGINHGEEALIAENAEDFAQAIITLYRDKELWEKLSHKGRELIARRFSSTPVRKNLENLLGNVITAPKWKKYL